ncbi:hypothetical protein BZZ01_00135 [Nostocales cyanobacterium HT-58-2]|nr:hypothetical protein BZZ01_00135 [Nostocales cyanobacterium HT-58-2]
MANYQRDKSGKLTQHFEEPKQQVSISITPTAIAGLDALAHIFGIEGRSALIEQLGRGTLQLSVPTSATQDFYDVSKQTNFVLPKSKRRRLKA